MAHNHPKPGSTPGPATTDEPDLLDQIDAEYAAKMERARRDPEYAKVYAKELEETAGNLIQVFEMFERMEESMELEKALEQINAAQPTGRIPDLSVAPDEV